MLQEPWVRSAQAASYLCKWVQALALDNHVFKMQLYYSIPTESVTSGLWASASYLQNAW
jgi:hypothetical protein